LASEEASVEAIVACWVKEESIGSEVERRIVETNSRKQHEKGWLKRLRHCRLLQVAPQEVAC